MRTIRIYQPGQYGSGDIVPLSLMASQHVAVVLRMQVNDPLILFCGDNKTYSAQITSIIKKQVIVKIIATENTNCESPCAIHLVQAISKGDRMEMVIQKAVELGVASITPLLSRYCVVRLDADRGEKKLAQWQAIVISACEQSGRNVVPIVRPIMTFEHYLQQRTETAGYQFVLTPTTNKSWRDYVFPAQNITVLIGPEGGFSELEIQQAEQAGFQLLSLGPRILRTETAAISALTLLQAVSGDL